MHQTQRTRRFTVLCTLSTVVLIFFYLSLFHLFLLFDDDSESVDISALTSQVWRPVASSSGDSNTASNVAAIIDNRPLDRLLPLLLHFSSILGPGWPIVFFTSTHNDIPMPAPLRRLIDERRIEVRLLADVDFNNRLDVSRFMTEPWIWEQLAPAGHVLMFQADSILCANSARRVDDFLEFDFIGAPIDPAYGEGYNGGLSLRNRSMVLDIIYESSWSKEFDFADDKQQPCVEFEDQWFYKKMKGLSDRGKQAARFPSLEVAKTFSVESIWHDEPMGYHQVQRWQSGRINEVERWCPEYKIATSDVIR